MAANDKDSVKSHANVLGTSGLNAKSITGIDVYRHGAVSVVQIVFSGGQQFIKFKHGDCEIGGNQDWDTGTKQNF